MRARGLGFAVAVGAVAVLATLSCGGGGGGGSGEQTVVLSVNGGDWDGHVTSEEEFESGVLAVGDDPDFFIRGCVGFVIADIPEGARILSARLRLRQVLVRGTPFAKLGSIYADHVTIEGGIGDGFRYSGGELEELAGELTLEGPDVPGAWRAVDVTDNLRADIALDHQRCCFRLRFWKPGPVVFLDDEVDGVAFDDFENTDGGSYDPPQIVVTFLPP